MFENKTFDQFTQLLASSAPVPGGGGASALVAAIGTALGNMVGALTVGKEKYAPVEEDMKRLMEKAEDLRRKSLALIEEDGEAFEPLSRAYGISKETPGRDALLEECLKKATEPPLEIFKLTLEAIEMQREFAEKGNPLVVSDAATGVAMCRAAMYGAAVNVKVNTKLMKDRAYAKEINGFIDSNLEKFSEMAEAVYQSVYSRFC